MIELEQRIEKLKAEASILRGLVEQCASQRINGHAKRVEHVIALSKVLLEERTKPIDLYSKTADQLTDPQDWLLFNRPDLYVEYHFHKRIGM